jgi:RNA polymerase sigma-B factor
MRANRLFHIVICIRKEIGLASHWGTELQGATTRRRSTGQGHGDRDESTALLYAYHSAGDASARDSARERLVELHLPLVRSLARRYANRGEGLEDLVQVGSIGLLESIDRFDPRRGTDLPSFAVPTITGVIRRHLRDRSTIVRMPRPLAEQARRPVCLSLAEGVSSEIDGAMRTEDAFHASEERMLIAAGFRALAPRERRILKLRYFAGLSQTEIAREVGLSQIQVSRLIRTSLDRMRAALEREPSGHATSLVRR